jgi:hypothetical protein
MVAEGLWGESKRQREARPEPTGKNFPGIGMTQPLQASYAIGQVQRGNAEAQPGAVQQRTAVQSGAGGEKRPWHCTAQRTAVQQYAAVQPRAEQLLSAELQPAEQRGAE